MHPFPADNSRVMAGTVVVSVGGSESLSHTRVSESWVV